MFFFFFPNLPQVADELVRLPEFRGGDADILPDVGRRHAPGRAGHLRVGEVLLAVAEFLRVRPARFAVRQVAGQPADTRNRLSRVGFI